MKEEEERVNIGKPKISELIAILIEQKEKHGDIPVSGSYDGHWNADVEMLLFEGHLIIGTIS